MNKLNKVISVVNIIIFPIWSVLVLTGGSVINTAGDGNDKWVFGLLLMAIAIHNASDLVTEIKKSRK